MSFDTEASAIADFLQVSMNFSNDFMNVYAPQFNLLVFLFVSFFHLLTFS